MNTAISKKSFVIRKKKVLDALFWLQKYNRHYSDAMVDATRLDWIEKDEAELPNTENKRVYYTDVEYAEGYNNADFFNTTVVNGVPQKDNGPAPSQVNEVKENALEIEYVVEGVVHNSFVNNPVDKDDQNTVKMQNLARESLGQGVRVTVPFTTTEQRRQATAGNKMTQSTQNSQMSASSDVEGKNWENQRATKETVSYPEVEESIVDEYDDTLDIFGMVFL